MIDKLFNPDYLYSLCKNYGLQPSKKYGQNYLVHPDKTSKADLLAAELNGTNVPPIEMMIEAADVKKTDTVVEVGPGFGVLTFALSEQAKQVIAFEIEKKLVPYWQDRKPENVNIIWGNVLNSPLFRREGREESREDSTPPLLLSRGGNYKVVANLPYQITSAVIRAFLESNNPPESMTLMVQKEVAERICAKAGDMSLLSVAVQYYADAEIVDFVPRDNFWPMPKVDSAIIKLSLRFATPCHCEEPQRATKQFQKSQESDGAVLPPPLPERGVRGEREFFHLVKAGFANRRKLLIKNLLPVIGKKNREALKKIFADIGLKETVRAQELSVNQWNQLTEKQRGLNA